jgi:glutathione S-transferase
MSLTLLFHRSRRSATSSDRAYENDTPFTPQIVNLRTRANARDLRLADRKIPVPSSRADWNVSGPSSSNIWTSAPGRTRLIPADPVLRQMRSRPLLRPLRPPADAVKIVGDRLRPADRKDPHGVAEARATMATALGLIDRAMEGKLWGGASRSDGRFSAAPPLV